MKGVTKKLTLTNEFYLFYEVLLIYTNPLLFDSFSHRGMRWDDLRIWKNNGECRPHYGLEVTVMELMCEYVPLKTKVYGSENIFYLSGIVWEFMCYWKSLTSKSSLVLEVILKVNKEWVNQWNVFSLTPQRGWLVSKLQLIV